MWICFSLPDVLEAADKIVSPVWVPVSSCPFAVSYAPTTIPSIGEQSKMWMLIVRSALVYGREIAVLRKQKVPLNTPEGRQNHHHVRPTLKGVLDKSKPGKISLI